MNLSLMQDGKDEFVYGILILDFKIKKAEEE